MISKIPPPITLGVSVAWLSVTALGGRPRHAPPPQLSGVLFSVEADSTTTQDVAETAGGAEWQAAVEKAAVPTLTVSVDPSAAGQLRPGSNYTVRLVAPHISSYTITLTRAAHSEPKRPTLKSASLPAPVVVSTTTSVPPVAEVPPPPPPDPPKPVEKPHPAGFAQYDTDLREGVTTKTVNVRAKDHGITFRATHIGRVGDQAVIRYALGNQEPADFFLSIINVTTDGKAIPAETLGPFVCQSGNESFGVVHFDAARAKGKNVTLELVQSGGDHRRLELQINYAF